MVIEIDLNETNTKSFNSGGLIQENAKSKFFDLINKLLLEIPIREDYKFSKNSFLRVHNTILINGKRGVGKTSFILSMMDALVDKLDICVLNIIDPTLIETKEHVFLNIITSIKDRVENYSKHAQNYHHDNNDSLREWKNSLKNLAGGLSILDGVGTNHLEDSMWDSPELILEKGLSNSKQGKDLEENFHKFIDESLKIIGSKAFFLVLDDIDTSLEKGISIMETLRKYLTSPKLIISILGDIDLYSILSRQLQWEKIDSKKILIQYEGKEKYIPQIEHLEEQYLIKILKPENRIDLDNLFDLKDNIKIKNDNNITLNGYLDNVVEEIYLTNNNYKKYYIETILTQSIRSVFQILKFYNNQKEQNSNFPNIIKHTFYTTLKKKLEDYKLLDIYKKEQYLNLLSIYIIKNNISRDNHLKLIPDFIDTDDNITMLYLNAVYNKLFKESKNYLDYFIKVGYTLEQFINLDINNEVEIKNFIEHIAIDSGESSSKIAKRLLTTSKVHSFTHKNPILFGSIFINNDHLKSLNNVHNKTFIISKVNLSTNSGYNFISFFNLLGLIIDISSIDFQKYDELSNIEDNIKNELKKILMINSQIFEFDSFDKNISEINDNIEDNNENNTPGIGSSIHDKLINQLYSWIVKKNQIKEVPLFVLSKIWVRFSYTLNNINKNRSNFKDYYEVFDMFIASFLNAVFVEISLYENEIFYDKNSIKNPEKAEYFYNKLEKEYNKKEDKYTLFDYLWECPFLNKYSADKIFSWTFLSNISLR